MVVPLEHRQYGLAAGRGGLTGRFLELAECEVRPCAKGFGAFDLFVPWSVAFSQTVAPGVSFQPLRELPAKRIACIPTARAVITGSLQRQGSLAEQVGRNVLVRFMGSLEQPAGLGRVAVLPEGDQGLGGRRLRVSSSY